MHSFMFVKISNKMKFFFWTSIETIIKMFQNILEFVSIDFWILILLKSIIRCIIEKFLFIYLYY